MSLAIPTIVGLFFKTNPVYSRGETRNDRAFDLAGDKPAKGVLMFGFGKKKTAMDRVTSETIYKLEDVNRRFPGAVPGRGIQVGKLALAIAAKTCACFNEGEFEKVLFQEPSIKEGFPRNWSRADALSRWYALGFICLTHCSMKSVWSNALTVDAGMQVYDASVEKMWILWSMSEEVRARLDSFMRSNIQNITRSLQTVVDAATRAEWFRRYAERIAGKNPPWEISGGWQSSVLEDSLRGDTVCTNLEFISDLSARFEVLAEGIMKLASGAEPLP